MDVYYILLIYKIMPSFYQNTLSKPFFPYLESLPPIQDEAQLNKQFVNVINAQAILIDKLLYNQKHLVESFRKLSSNEGNQPTEYYLNKQKWNDLSRQSNLYCSQIDLNKSIYQKQSKTSVKPNKVKIIQKPKMKEYFSFQESDQQENQSSGSQFKLAKKSQTKNVIKNFAKAIFKFIRKQRVYVQNVLQREQVKEEFFYKFFQSFKGKIHTIMDLKKLWLPEGNPCHKVFRIISINFLRKYSLNHIFNSRVQNFKVHIKYRLKMYEILQNPQNFSSIKFN